MDAFSIKTFLKTLFAIKIFFLCSLLSVLASAQQNWSYTYNSLGLIESEDGPRTDVQDVNTYTYDAAGNKTSATNALGQVTQYLDYDARGNAGRIIDSNGVETILTYHPRGWLATATLKHPVNSYLDAQTRYHYDGVSGLLTETIFPNGARFHYEYDAARRLIVISNHLGERIDYTLDKAGNKLQDVISENENGSQHITQVINRSYDELSRLKKLLGNNNQVTEHHYDSNDNTTLRSDANANNTLQGFDALNRRISITQANGARADFIYDKQDRIISVIDARGITTTYSYDAFDNVLAEHSPDRGTIIYTYDAANNRISQGDARGIKTRYHYDALNRLTQVLINADDQHPENISFFYDDVSNGNYGVGRLTSYRDESGVTHLFYNHRALLEKKSYTINGKTYTQQWAYDLAGNLISETYPSGRVIEYNLNSSGKISAIQMRTHAAAPAQGVINNIKYQPFGSVKSFDYANGIRVEYHYDLDGRIQNISATGAAPLQEKIYFYDLADNIVAIDDNVDAHFDQWFALDTIYRITMEEGFYGNRNYNYDQSSNRINRSISNAGNMKLTYEADSNRLTKIRANVLVEHDASGNMTRVVRPNGKQDYFSYNDSGRLSAYGNADSNPLKRYQYNALGQRVYDEHLAGNDKSMHYTQAGAYQARHVYVDGSTQVRRQQEWIYLEGIPVAQMDSRIRANGKLNFATLHFIHSDHLATPRLMSDENQNIVWRWDSDAFGLGGISTDPDDDSVKANLPLRFPGQIAEGPSGLYYNYYRDYDPQLGRYIQSDPIGLEGGLNTFGYVGGNPLIYSDPYGLFFAGSDCGSGWNAKFIPDGSDSGKLKQACKNHDLCYSTCGKSKLTCDLEFLANGANDTYVFAVMNLKNAKDAYEKSQENCDGCK